MKTNLTHSIPLPVLDFLIAAAREFRSKGADLLVFGSFARGRQRANSDLDIAIRWLGPPDSEIRSQISEHLDRMPTIRPVDLVDLQDVGQELRDEVESAAVALADL